MKFSITNLTLELKNDSDLNIVRTKFKELQEQGIIVYQGDKRLEDFKQ